MQSLFVNQDTLIEWDEMALASDESYLTGATAAATIYRQRAADGAMAAIGTTLTCASGPFVSGDSGKSIIVHGAGTEESEHRTTIASVTNSTTVVLTDAAIRTVSGAVVELSVANAVALSMAYVGVNGKYQGTVPKTAPLRNQAPYVAEITVTSGANDGFARIPCMARYRDEDGEG